MSGHVSILDGIQRRQYDDVSTAEEMFICLWTGTFEQCQRMTSGLLGLGHIRSLQSECVVLLFIVVINVENFLGSLTTVVRAQNDTSKTANVTFWFLVVLRVKILSFDPQKALPCVNTHLLMYRVSKSVQQPELLVGRKIFAYKERNFKKLSGNFGYMGRSNPLGDLDHMWHVGRYDGRNHVCNIW